MLLSTIQIYARTLLIQNRRRRIYKPETIEFINMLLGEKIEIYARPPLIQKTQQRI